MLEKVFDLLVPKVVGVVWMRSTRVCTCLVKSNRRFLHCSRHGVFWAVRGGFLYGEVPL